MKIKHKQSRGLLYMMSWLKSQLPERVFASSHPSPESFDSHLQPCNRTSNFTALAITLIAAAGCQTHSNKCQTALGSIWSVSWSQASTRQNGSTLLSVIGCVQNYNHGLIRTLDSLKEETAINRANLASGER